MKKFICIILCLFTLTACYKIKYKSTTLTYEELIDKFKNKESFVLYIGEKTCYSCKEYRVIVDEFCADRMMNIYYYDASDYESEQVNDIIYNYVYVLENNPTTYIVLEGKSVDYQEGILNKTELLRLVKEYGLLP